MVQINEISYKNFGRCLELKNEKAAAIVTVDIGPRIISWHLNGRENVLFEDVDRVFSENCEEHKKLFGGEPWYIYGGHRLWSSPESMPHSYVPDNHPVEYSIDKETGSVLLTAPETRTGQIHSWTVAMDNSLAALKVTHTITNTSGAIVTLAPWAMTVCAPGGVEIFPQNSEDTGLLSNRLNVYWSYSDINDERFFLGNKYGTLRQVPGSEGKFKIGMNNEDGWAAYVCNGQIFYKEFDYSDGAEYPDHGCNFETFTNGLFLECESLGHLKTLKNGESVTHAETWELFECGDSFDPRSEESIDAFVKRPHSTQHA